MFLRLFRMFFGGSSKNNETKTCVDSRLGKLTCEFDRKKDEFFFWETEIDTINEDKTPTFISIDGDINGPNSNALETIYKVIDSIDSITDDVQKELNTKYPEKNIDLSNGYILDDISVFSDDDVECELEFSSEEEEEMVSVSLKNNKITELDIY